MITSLADLRPGDIGFGPIGGAAGLVVKAGQLMLGERVRLGRVSIDHVFVVTDAQYLDGDWSNVANPPMCVEAMPGGARHVSIADRWTDRYAYVRPNYPGEKYTGMLVATEARCLIDTPYSFLDYASLAARERHISAWMPDALEDRIAQRVLSSGSMICSQLADQALTRAGYQVFDDGRLSQEVMPGELFHQLTHMLGGKVYIPGSISIARGGEGGKGGTPKTGWRGGDGQPGINSDGSQGGAGGKGGEMFGGGRGGEGDN